MRLQSKKPTLIGASEDRHFRYEHWLMYTDLDVGSGKITLAIEKRTFYKKTGRRKEMITLHHNTNFFKPVML